MTAAIHPLYVEAGTPLHLQGDEPKETPARRIDLMPFLDGTFTPPQPAVGGLRDDGVQLLYPGRWHTLIGPTEAGKSWFALWQIVQVLRDGGTVVYAHFEETLPSGTIARLRAVAPDLNDDVLCSRFVWLDCSDSWRPGEFAYSLPESPTLVVLDGINAACGQHGWDVNTIDAVGTYRRWFVTPATRRDAAVLSLGHPPKARDRQDERHSFGSSAWLDEVDGAAFRIEAAKATPIRRGHRGYSALYTVKDRYGEVKRRGRLEPKRDGWNYLGAFTLDDSPERANTCAYLTGLPAVEEVNASDGIDHLADRVVAHLAAGDGGFASQSSLIAGLRAARVAFNDKDVAPALGRLAATRRIDWPEGPTGRPRPGRLIEPEEQEPL